jgi:hypothetical protein
LVQAGGDRQGANYSPDAYAIFPRYNMLHAILLQVEALDYDHLPDFATLRNFLMAAALRADTVFTKDPSHPIQRAAQEEESALFSEAIRAVAVDGGNTPAPLPYRRVLNSVEVSKIRASLASSWGVTTTYWYPLGAKTHSSLVAFDLDAIDEAGLQQGIRDFFRTRQIERIFELREFGPENYFLEAQAGDLNYSGAEGYWVSSANDWIVYCSHERTITLGGSIVEIAPQ